MDLQTYIRESVTLVIPLTEGGIAGGTPFAPGENYNLIFTVKRDAKDADAEAVFQKQSGAGIEVNDTDALVSLVPDDTTDLDAINLVFDVRGQHVVTGARKTLGRGNLKLSRDITRETEVSVPVTTTEPPLPFPAIGRIYNTTTETYYILTLSGTPGNEIINWNPE